MDRRRALQALSGSALALAGCARTNVVKEERTMGNDGNTAATKTNEGTSGDSASKMPVIFAAHGAPMLLDDAAWMKELADWAKAMPKPKAILVISAHWEEHPAAIGATTKVPLIYDFYGFPQHFYETQYGSPGAPQLAARVRELFAERGLPLQEKPTRGLDHGAYIPLIAMYPLADVPVLQISLPALDGRKLADFGKTLAPLRDEGVLIFGSGFLTHNMRLAFTKGVPAWASEFDLWAKEAFEKFDLDSLIEWKTRAPAAEIALPTWEHYAPAIVAAAAAGPTKPTISFPITGFWMGPFTKRSVQFG